MEDRSQQIRPAPDRRAPTQNRELAYVHAKAQRGRVDRRALAVSLFAFFATIVTLGWFILTNFSADIGGNDVSAVAAGPGGEGAREAALAPPMPEPTVASAIGHGAPAEAGQSDLIFFGEPVSDWFDDQEGGWGEH